MRDIRHVRKETRDWSAMIGPYMIFSLNAHCSCQNYSSLCNVRHDSVQLRSGLINAVRQGVGGILGDVQNIGGKGGGGGRLIFHSFPQRGWERLPNLHIEPVFWFFGIFRCFGFVRRRAWYFMGINHLPKIRLRESVSARKPTLQIHVRTAKHFVLSFLRPESSTVVLFDSLFTC